MRACWQGDNKPHNFNWKSWSVLVIMVLSLIVDPLSELWFVGGLGEEKDNDLDW